MSGSSSAGASAAMSVKAIFKRTLSFNKGSASSKGGGGGGSSSSGSTPSVNHLEVPTTPTNALSAMELKPPLPSLSSSSSRQPQIRVTDATPVHEPMFSIEEIFHKKTQSEVGRGVTHHYRDFSISC